MSAALTSWPDNLKSKCHQDFQYEQQSQHIEQRAVNLLLLEEYQWQSQPNFKGWDNFDKMLQDKLRQGPVSERKKKGLWSTPSCSTPSTVFQRARTGSMRCDGGISQAQFCAGRSSRRPASVGTGRVARQNSTCRSTSDVLDCESHGPPSILKQTFCASMHLDLHHSRPSVAHIVMPRQNRQEMLREKLCRPVSICNNRFQRQQSGGRKLRTGGAQVQARGTFDWLPLLSTETYPDEDIGHLFFFNSLPHRPRGYSIHQLQ